MMSNPSRQTHALVTLSNVDYFRLLDFAMLPLPLSNSNSNALKKLMCTYNSYADEYKEVATPGAALNKQLISVGELGFKWNEYIF